MEVHQLKVVGSGSSGNCLAISDSRGKYILIDVGVKYDTIMQNIDYMISDCVLVLCSHHHKDHSRSLSKFIDLGIPCYGNVDVCSRYKGCELIADMIEVDGFCVSTFPLSHDVDNNAFVIDTIDGMRFLYCTDTTSIANLVKNVNCAIIEANWDADFMFGSVIDGMTINSNYNNHHSLDSCIDYLSRIATPALQVVVLWHLSNQNISGKIAMERATRVCPNSDVFIAKAGLVIKTKKQHGHIRI